MPKDGRFLSPRKRFSQILCYLTAILAMLATLDTTSFTARANEYGNVPDCAEPIWLFRALERAYKDPVFKKKIQSYPRILPLDKADEYAHLIDNKIDQILSGWRTNQTPRCPQNVAAFSRWAHNLALQKANLCEFARFNDADVEAVLQTALTDEKTVRDLQAAQGKVTLISTTLVDEKTGRPIIKPSDISVTEDGELEVTAGLNSSANVAIDALNDIIGEELTPALERLVQKMPDKLQLPSGISMSSVGAGVGKSLLNLAMTGLGGGNPTVGDWIEAATSGIPLFGDAASMLNESTKKDPNKGKIILAAIALPLAAVSIAFPPAAPFIAILLAGGALALVVTEALENETQIRARTADAMGNIVYWDRQYQIFASTQAEKWGMANLTLVKLYEGLQKIVDPCSAGLWVNRQGKIEDYSSFGF
ncbi:hypothetical protein OV450_7697 [Actinobacteria bacterium OV450]|nr:hypothetical protein OV450_7697 [Actinobacteria bacterium OV450]